MTAREPAPGSKPAPAGRRFPFLRCAAVLAALAGLWFLLPRPPDLSLLGETIARANPALLGLMLLAQQCSNALRALRLHIILQDGQPYWRTFHVVTTGIMTNNLLPLRAGEFCMAALLARHLPGGGAEALSKILADRLLDMLAVGSCFVAALLLVPSAQAAQESARGLVSTLAAVGAILAVLAFVICCGPWLAERLHTTGGRLGRLLAPLAATLHASVEGLRALLRKGVFLRLAGLALLTWLAVSAGFLLGMRMLGLAPPFACALLAMCLTIAGLVTVPTPAGVGSAHGAIVIALTLYDIPFEQALAFAFVYHTLITAMNIATGLVSLRFLRLNFSGLKRLASTGHPAP